MLYDLHLHSTCSDGDLAPSDVVRQAKERGVAGVSITDHNGVWGVTDAATTARALGLEALEGIEVSVVAGEASIHVLGYSRSFKREVLREGFRSVREGYAQRIQAMVERCHAAGFTGFTFADIVARRSHLVDPVYVAYDVAKLLQERHELTGDEAQKMTVKGGVGYVPAGAWALPLPEAIDIVHAAGGIAVLAHPGIIAHEGTEKILKDVLATCSKNGLDGIEVIHPFHTVDFQQQLRDWSNSTQTIITGGSDWHGPTRYVDANFGKFGVTSEEWKVMLERVDSKR